MTTKEKFQVLVADDSVNDRILLRHALENTTRLEIAAEVADGGEVISYLSRSGKLDDAANPGVPDLLLLDLKMPGRDGFEVLEWLRKQTLHGLSVVVLTHSVKPEDIRRALDLGADYFQVKPRSHKDFVSMVLAIEERLINGMRQPGAKSAGRPSHFLAGAHHFAHAR
jgi:CheY-like chemotaxis protein